MRAPPAPALGEAMFWLARLVVLRALVRGLSEEDLAPDPVDQFNRWHRLARRVGIPNANAVALATATAGGAPSVRMVLLKQIAADGLVFYTNYESRKGVELEQNPQAALVAYWRGMERQVRAEGRVQRISREESEAYFASRPRGSRIGAWASRQSRPSRGREELEQAVEDTIRRFASGRIPCPPFWGGFRLTPHTIEIWQGRASRLHDRFRYQRGADGWSLCRLFP